MTAKEKQDGYFRPIVVAVVIAVLAGGSAPWWFGRAEQVFANAFRIKLIPDNMAGVWIGTLHNSDNAGSTNVVYTLYGDGRIVVKDDPTYNHPPTTYHARANGQTISFSLNVEGLGVHRTEMTLVQSDTLHLKVFKRPESQGTLTEGDLILSGEVPSGAAN